MDGSDPRLVSLYDLDNPDGPDHDYYRALADRLEADTIVDLGCGTGLLTVTFASPTRHVVGVDPDREMLKVARARPGGALVEWIVGDSRAIPPRSADLVVMSGNVAQAILGEEWPRTLRDVAAVTRPEGVLAFESRNPAGRALNRWNRDETFGTRDTPSGRLTEWLDVTQLATDGTVTFEAHTVFEASGEHLTCTSTLAFRERGQIEADLHEAGFEVTDVYGGWRHEQFDESSALIVVEARRSTS